MASENKKEKKATVQAAPAATVSDVSAGSADIPAPVPVKTETTADKGKEKKKQKIEAESAAGVLEKVGKAAIARHGFTKVFVTMDGQVFPILSDAKNHAINLANKEIIKVPKQ